MTPTSFHNPGRVSLKQAAFYVLSSAFRETIFQFHNPERTARNAEIRFRYANRYTIPELASLCGVSNARIHQILPAE